MGQGHPPDAVDENVRCPWKGIAQSTNSQVWATRSPKPGAAPQWANHIAAPPIRQWLNGAPKLDSAVMAKGSQIDLLPATGQLPLKLAFGMPNPPLVSMTCRLYGRASHADGSYPCRLYGRAG